MHVPSIPPVLADNAGHTAAVASPHHRDPLTPPSPSKIHLLWHVFTSLPLSLSIFLFLELSFSQVTQVQSDFFSRITVVLEKKSLSSVCTFLKGLRLFGFIWS